MINAPLVNISFVYDATVVSEGLQNLGLFSAPLTDRDLYRAIPAMTHDLGL